MRIFHMLKIFIARESGTTLIEAVVALAVLGTIGVTFLSGLAITSKAAFISDEQATAESLAQSQMEWVKNASYSYNATSYTSAPIPPIKDYLDYSATIIAAPLRNPDDGIQRITVTVKRADETTTKLEGYKVDR